VDQECAFIHEYGRQDELKLLMPQLDGPRLLSDGLMSERCGPAAVELADVEVELEGGGGRESWFARRSGAAGVLPAVQSCSARVAPRSRSWMAHRYTY
jgi:hypothetical protein